MSESKCIGLRQNALNTISKIVYAKTRFVPRNERDTPSPPHCTAMLCYRKEIVGLNGRAICRHPCNIKTSQHQPSDL